MLALDHVFCFVAAPGPAAARPEAAGWHLDAGIELVAGADLEIAPHVWLRAG